MKILFIGDIVGVTGKWVVSEVLKKTREEFSIDLCIANGENLAGGKGLTDNLAGKLKNMGVDVITSGNHIWESRDILTVMNNSVNILRPLNYPQGNPGKGSTIVMLPSGESVGIINLQGRTFMFNINCPFTEGLREVEEIRKKTPAIFVDFHAETTSEKISMGWYLDGKVSAVIGTHTHVQTADERVLPGGTAYITDAGMTGSRNSVIGLKKEIAIRRFLLQTPARFEPAEGDPIFNAVIVDIDGNTGKAKSIQRIFKEVPQA